MRIISGKIKGKKLFSPIGLDTRPTSDRTKEAVFNIICHNYLPYNLENTNVLDVFAGSGALGFEALSRGALSTCFIENNPEAVACIKKNIDICGFKDNAHIINDDALKTNNLKKNKYSLVFLDPPYKKDLVVPTLNNLEKQTFLSDNALIVIETSNNEDLKLSDSYEIINQKIYGAAKVTFCRYLL